MKIDSIDNIYNYYEINNIAKFDVIMVQLFPLIQKCIDNSSHYKITATEVIDMFRDSLYRNDKKFKLWVILKDKEVIAFFSCYIIIDADGIRCLVYGVYAANGMLLTLMPKAIRHITEYAKDMNCKSIVFFTDRNDNVFSRLIRKYNFKKTRSVFEMEVEENV